MTTINADFSLHEGDAGYSASGFQTIAIFRQSATAIYGQLREALIAADVWLEGAKWKLDKAVADGGHTALNAARATLEKIQPNGVMTLKVLDGAASPAQWQALADVVSDNITGTLESVGASLPTLDRLQKELLAPSVTTIVKELEQLPSELGSALPYIIAGIVGVLVLVVLIKAL